MLEKLDRLFSPKRMFYFNISMAVVDMILAIIFHGAGLASGVSQLFLFGAVCFMLAGLANWWRLRIQEENSNKSKK